MKYQITQAVATCVALTAWIAWYGCFGFRTIPVEVFRWILLVLACWIPAGPVAAIYLMRSKTPMTSTRTMIMLVLLGLVLNVAGACIAFAVVVFGRGMTGAGT